MVAPISVVAHLARSTCLVSQDSEACRVKGFFFLALGDLFLVTLDDFYFGALLQLYI